jgi:hypothetical protein
MAERDALGRKVHYTRTDRGIQGYKPTWEQEQNVLSFRKLLMRRHILRWLAGRPGAFYVPFMGDGDIADALYRGRAIYGADLDPDRVAVARGRFPDADIRIADCDAWPFVDIDVPFALADFDAFSAPYASFRSFWKGATKAERLVVIFTDGHRQGLNRTGWFNHPSGEKIRLGRPGGPRMGDRDLKLPYFNAYLTRYIWPWFDALIAKSEAGGPFRVLDRWRYQRDMMIYWAMAIERIGDGAASTGQGPDQDQEGQPGQAPSLGRGQEGPEDPGLNVETDEALA